MTSIRQSPALGSDEIVVSPCDENARELRTQSVAPARACGAVLHVSGRTVSLRLEGSDGGEGGPVFVSAGG